MRFFKQQQEQINFYFFLFYKAENDARQFGPKLQKKKMQKSRQLKNQGAVVWDAVDQANQVQNVQHLKEKQKSLICAYTEKIECEEFG